MKTSKIAIIGAGAVGSTTAYAIMLKNIAAEIILVDINTERCEGEVLDLSDALSFYRSSDIRRGSTKDIHDADIIIICAGIAQKPGQTRTELLQKNSGIIESIFKEICPINKNSIVIMVSNPVDLMTLKAQKCANIPRNQIFGTGTMLDSQRVNVLLADIVSVAEQSITAYILGEHGDTQFPAWSCAYIAGIPISEFPGVTPKQLDAVANQVKNKAYEIIKCKGATYYGIAACVAKLCECILFNQHLILPVSQYLEEFELYLSMPAVIGRNGIEQRISLMLNDKEESMLAHSAHVLKELL